MSSSTAPWEAGGNEGRRAVDGGGGMLTILHVLSVGSAGSNDSVRDALLSRAKCQLIAAADVWDLSALLASNKIDVAVLHDTLSPAELRSCAAYIRHHWPVAQILLIHAQAEILDDPMYDERMLPGSPADSFLIMIERLAAFARRGVRRSMTGNAERLRAVRK